MDGSKQWGATINSSWWVLLRFRKFLGQCTVNHWTSMHFGTCAMLFYTLFLFIYFTLIFFYLNWLLGISQMKILLRLKGLFTLLIPSKSMWSPLNVLMVLDHFFFRVGGQLIKVLTSIKVLPFLAYTYSIMQSYYYFCC